MAGMRPALHAYEIGGDELGRIPSYLTADWYSARGELPTLKIAISELMEGYDWLRGPVEVGIKLPTPVGWVTPRNDRFIVHGDKWDRRDDKTRTHSLDFVSVLSELSRQPIEGDPGQKRWLESVTPGKAMRILLEEAHAKNGVTWLTLGCTDTHDSLGEPWAGSMNIELDPGGDTALKTLQDMHAKGACEFWTQGRVLHLANADSHQSRPIYVPDVAVPQSPEDVGYESIATHILVVGDEGEFWEFENPEAMPDFGRRVRVLKAGGVTSQAMAQSLAQTEFLRTDAPANSFSRQWVLAGRRDPGWFEQVERFRKLGMTEAQAVEAVGSQPYPGRDMDLHDLIFADTRDGQRQQLHVAAMALKVGKSVEATVTLGTVKDSLIQRLAKQQTALAGAGVTVGRTPTPIPPPTNDGSQWPEAPTGLAVTAGTWTSADGKAQGHISATWNPVTLDTAGNPVTVKGYQLRARRTSAPATSWVDIMRESGTSGTVTRTDMTAGETWQVIIAAVSGYENANGEGENTGPFSIPPVTFTVQQDTQAPNTPSAPVVTSTPASYNIEWDEKDSSGGDMPPDFAKAILEIEGISDTWEMTGSSLRIPAGRGEKLLIGSDYRARLKAVDVAGNESPWSAWSGWVRVRARDVWPVKVTGLVANSETILGPDGRGVGIIHASWVPVTQDAEGNTISIAHYVVRAESDGVRGWHEFGPFAGTTGSGSNNDFTVGTTWNVRVAAVHVDGNDNWTGPFSDPVPVTIGPDTVPPSVPSTPLVSSSMAGLTITWDGLTSTGAQMPIDLAHIEAHITGRATPVPIDKITRQVTIWDVTVGTSYEVRLRAVDYAGNVSALSAAASVTVVSAITGLQAQIDQVEDDFAAADAALQGQIDSIVVSSSGGVVTWMGPTTPVAPSQRPHIAGDLWWDTSTGVQKRYDGSAWVVFQLGNDGIAGISAAKLTTGFLDTARLKTDAAWVTGPLLIGNTDEVVIDPTWQNADLNADRTRSPWALVDAEWVKSAAAPDEFMLAAKSSWSASDPACHMQLRSGVRYRIEATVFLTAAGNVGIVHRDASGGYGWVTGPVALAAFTSYQLVGEFTWGTSPGAFGIRFETAGYLSKVSVRPMLAQVLIQDGLISTPKLAANAVTSDKINAGAVTALKLSTDALDFKSATGMVLTSPTIQSHTEAFRGFKLTPTAFKLYSSDGLGTEWFSADSSGVRVAGDFQTTGQYPRLEIKRDLMGSTFSGIRWYPQAGWQSWPELKITSTAWGVDTPGGLYAVGGTRHNLTMHPELALRSGYMNGSEERYWPKADLLLGAGGTTYGRIRIEDLGLNTTAFSAYANFHDLFTPSRAQELLLNVPGSPGDIRIKSAAAGISLEVGNGWLRTQGIGTSTGGEDIRMEGNWRLVYQTSLSADKLDQQRMGVHYELLDLKATSWIDRVRREEDPSWDVRYGGWIAEDVQAISEANGDSLAPALVHRGGELSGINDKAINALHLDITADIVRRLSRVEAAIERILDAA